MCKKLIYLIPFVLVLGLVGSASAALPQGWQSQDIGTTGGSADESGGTWTVSGDGADVWGSSDAFHYAYVPLSGDGMIIARVVDNGTGSNSWAKGGVMIRETLDANSKHMIMALTGGDGSGIAFQGRFQNTGSSSSSLHGTISAAPPYWVKLTREGNTITGYHSADGVDWEEFTGGADNAGGTISNPMDIDMATDAYIGIFVTSHAAGEVRTYTFDNVGTELPKAAMGADPADGAIHADTWANLSWAPGATAVSHDVYFGENFDDVSDGTESTFQGNQAETYFIVGFPGMPYPEGLVPGTTYYWRVDELEADGTTKYEGKVWSFMIPPKTAYYPDPADAAESVDPDVTLSWTAGFGAKLHYVYFGDNFDDINNAAGGLPLGTATYDPGPLELAKTYYWRVDEFDIIETHKGDVWSFTTEGAVGNPNPANGAVDIKQTQIITFSPSIFAASHQVYFGADKDAVKNANTGSPEYKGTRDLGSESYDPGILEWDTTYYWRIDEVNNANPDSPWTGILWSFTTANFLIVDDFESYNDLDPADPDSNRIFNAWIDGYDDPANGSLVGYETPPFAEQTIVHGGNQSMPLYYDNSVGYSEATLMLTYPRDWRENGVTTLTIWFRGISDNAAETLYVALNGSAIVSHDNPDAAQVYEWTRWNIDLQAFADQGVNLTNVNTIALGLGNKNNPQAGGSGTMYFDDIRLYPPPPAP